MPDPNDPNALLLPGIGSDVNSPLTGWTTSMPSTTFAPNGGIGGDWRFPSMAADLRTLPAPAPVMRPRVLRAPAPAPSLANAPMPPARPNFNVPVGQVAQTPQPGNANLWDALRALFSGQPSAQGQGMSGMLAARGQGARGTDALGNPFNRFG